MIEAASLLQMERACTMCVQRCNTTRFAIRSKRRAAGSCAKPCYAERLNARLRVRRWRVAMLCGCSVGSSAAAEETVRATSSPQPGELPSFPPSSCLLADDGDAYPRRRSFALLLLLLRHRPMPAGGAAGPHRPAARAPVRRRVDRRGAQARLVVLFAVIQEEQLQFPCRWENESPRRRGGEVSTQPRPARGAARAHGALISTPPRLSP